MGPALGLSLHNDINHDVGLALLMLRTLRWFLNFKEGRDWLLTGRDSSILRLFPDLGWDVQYCAAPGCFFGARDGDRTYWHPRRPSHHYELTAWERVGRLAGGLCRAGMLMCSGDCNV